MKRRIPWKLMLLLCAVAVPVALIATFLISPAREVRGKSPALPLSDALTREQQLAQDLALSDSRVQSYTVGRRSEVFGVRSVGYHFPASSQACATAECWQVEIYNFDEDAAVVAFVDVDAEEVLDVFYQPGVQPGLNKRLADLALDIALNHPDVIEELGFRPTKADMAPVESGLTGTACDHGHLCVGPTFELGDRILWAIVDLTDETLAGITYTLMEPNPPNNAMGFSPQGCPPVGSVIQDGWELNYEVTGTDGLRVYGVSYNGVPVMTSAKLVEWHADYGSSGFMDYTGCGGGGGGFAISPYGNTVVQPLEGSQRATVGFEVVQDFRMSSWGNFCNYRYEQHFQFFDDGRFRVVGGAYGKGCGTNAIYRPLVRMDIAVDGDDNDTFSIYDGSNWIAQSSEGWWSQAAPYTVEGYKWRVTDSSGAGYYIEPGQDSNFGDGGRGDNAFVYVVQHHPLEGDTDLGIIGTCCNDTYVQGPQIYINQPFGEPIAGENIVIWYVPQYVTDATESDGTPYYCWTLSGEPNPVTYPCFGGPMFVPIGGATGPQIAVSPPALTESLQAGQTATQTLQIQNPGDAPLTWSIAEVDPDGPSALDLSLQSVAAGFSQPLDIAHAGDDRLFIVEKAGTIRIIDGVGSVLPADFLDIQARVRSVGSEQGLLGLAFPPDYAETGVFYVNYTNLAGDTQVSRFSVTADPNIADPNSEQLLLTVDQPYSNHNGGDLAFGPDGNLYIGMGDGGNAGDPENRAQNPLTLLGKMLRLDVSGANYAIPPDNPFVGDAGVLDEIWALGLRNPWRFGFDRVSGDLFIGDVGQNQWEEIDFQPAASAGGENYGWRCYEGNHPYNTSGCLPAGAYDGPIFEYNHSLGVSVTGGRVYRGGDYPAMFGHYLLSDYGTGSFWSLVPNGIGGWTSFHYPGIGGFGVVAVGEDARGELYAANISTGVISRLVENSPSNTIPWVSVTPETGETPAAGTSDVTVAFDAAAMTGGTYTGDLRIVSNAVDQPVLIVPVTLTVEGPQVGLAISDGMVGSGLPGSTVTYTVALTNTGTSAVTVDLAVDSGWNASLSTSSVDLWPGAGTLIDAVVTVPADAQAGAEDVATVTATVTTDPGVSASTAFTTTAEAVYDLALVAGGPVVGEPGATVTITVQLTNAGNGLDSFDVVPTTGWAASVPSSPVTLDAGETVTVSILVDIPASAADGTVETVSIAVTSQSDGFATATVTVDVTVEAAPEPGPDWIIYLPAVAIP